MRTNHTQYTVPTNGITPAEYRALHHAITDYMESFRNSHNVFDAPLQLKVDHTYRVAEECRRLSALLGWPEQSQCAAELMGLLHDIGRFTQYTDFGSFSDPITVNHGQRGAEVLEKTELLAVIHEPMRTLLIDSVRWHNARELPNGLNKELLPWVWLIRDADKIDIYHIVLEAYHHDGFSELPAMLPHINLSSQCNPRCITEFEEEKCSSTKTAQTLGDFFVLLLSWIYVINYRPTLDRLQQQNVFNRVLSCIEPIDIRERIRNKLDEYLGR